MKRHYKSYMGKKLISEKYDFVQKKKENYDTLIFRLTTRLALFQWAES